MPKFDDINGRHDSAAPITFHRICRLIVADTIVRNEFKNFLSCTPSPATRHLPQEVTVARAFGKVSVNWMNEVLP
jgi:hypothetical protein